MFKGTTFSDTPKAADSDRANPFWDHAGPTPSEHSENDTPSVHSSADWEYSATNLTVNHSEAARDAFQSAGEKFQPCMHVPPSFASTMTNSTAQSLFSHIAKRSRVSSPSILPMAVLANSTSRRASAIRCSVLSPTRRTRQLFARSWSASNGRFAARLTLTSSAGQSAMAIVHASSSLAASASSPSLEASSWVLS